MNAQDIRNLSDKNNTNHIKGMIKMIERYAYQRAKFGYYQLDTSLHNCSAEQAEQLKQHFNHLGYRTSFYRTIKPNRTFITFSLRWDNEPEHIDVTI